MTGSERFVADTDVLVSFVLRPNSNPGQAVTRALHDLLMAFSAATLAELHDVLKRPKFDRYVSKRQRPEALRLLEDAALHVEVVEPIQARGSPRDDRILEAAVPVGPS